MYKRTTTWTRPGPTVEWSWVGQPTHADFDYTRRTSPGYIDGWISETDTTFVLVNIWQTEQDALNFESSKVFTDFDTICTPVRIERGITREFSGETI